MRLYGENRSCQNCRYLTTLDYRLFSGIVISKRFIKKTKPRTYEKWGHNIQSMATSRLRVIFLAFFTDFGSFLRHFLSLRTIAQTFRLWISLQLLWLYKGHSGYCFDISISWVSFYITLLNYNRTKCNKKPLEFVTKGLRRLGDEKII